MAEGGVMEIVLRVERTADGRLSGSVEADGRVVRFSGSMELLAAIERLSTVDDGGG